MTAEEIVADVMYKAELAGGFTCQEATDALAMSAPLVTALGMSGHDVVTPDIEGETLNGR